MYFNASWNSVDPTPVGELPDLLLSEGARPRSHLARSRPGVSRSERTVTFSSTAAAAVVVAGGSPEDARFRPRLRWACMYCRY